MSYISHEGTKGDNTMNQQSTASIQRIPLDNVYNDIHTFIDRFKSEKTKENYLRHIEEFFQFMHGKKLNELNKEDIEYASAKQGKEKMLMKHADKYKIHLRKKHPHSASSVLAKLSAVRSLYKYLSINGYDANHLIFDMQFLKANSKNYDNIPSHLVIPMSDLAVDVPYAGQELSVFILLAAQTSGRVQALLNVKKKHIIYDKRENIYLADILDKGDDLRTVSIDANVYEKIMHMCKDKEDNDYIFTKLKVDWVNKTIKKLSLSFEELKGKNIVTHSLRHSAAVHEMDTTGDIRAVQAQTGHRSTEVAIKIYAKKTMNYRDRAGIRMMRQVNESVLDNLSKEDILKTLKRISPSAYHQLLLECEKK
jgi:integrase